MHWGRKLPLGGFKWRNNKSNFDENFIKNWNENSNKGLILEVDAEYLKHLHNLHNDLSFLTMSTKKGFNHL